MSEMSAVYIQGGTKLYFLGSATVKMNLAWVAI